KTRSTTPRPWPTSCNGCARRASQSRTTSGCSPGMPSTAASVNRFCSGNSWRMGNICPFSAKEQRMITRLARVTIYVHDQDEALAFYTEKLGLEKRSDVTFGPGARWLTVAPAGQTDFEILLQSPVPAMHGEEFAQKISERVGQGTTWVFFTDD